ncbi:MAG: hypothetical protein M1818_002326 [Claussenomyces sp. TS43310]|nr:MAG: hypothetical protein M1818_002326 [Claussenomyces sp. TS43310]
MDAEGKANGITAPSFKQAQSAPSHQRRRSLPLHFLPPALWSTNTSRASLLESEEAARGEHILDAATIAHRIAALRQLNSATSDSHRYAKSTGTRSSTYNQPVIVRTYSGTRPHSRHREVPPKKAIQNMGKAELPPLEAFTFKGIMDSIQCSVADDLDRIAEICARSRYSLSNQYEVHMPPHGEGDPFLLQTAGHTLPTGGPTLEAVRSDDEQARTNPRTTRGGRRTKSVAVGTLETIMSSSKSSDEDKSKKEPAAVLAGEVRGRAAEKASTVVQTTDPDESAGSTSNNPDRPKHTRSRSATFASMIIDSAQSFTSDAFDIVSPTYLVSEPARPQTSIPLERETSSLTDSVTITSPTTDSVAPLPALIRNESRASTLRPDTERVSVLDSLTSWLPWSWSSDVTSSGVTGRERNNSHAEGSLRDLLKASGNDIKGKGADRAS